MRKKADKARRNGRIGPRIIRAWFDTVINPLLRSLETERESLADKNWTWRFRPAGFEVLRPARAHLDSWAWDNAEHLFEFYPEVKRAVDEHDGAVESFADACRKLQQAILASSELSDLYRRTTSPDSLSQLKTSLFDLFGAYPESDHLALLAQHIINHVDDLPGYHPAAPLWNLYKDEFKEIPGCSSVKGHYETALALSKELHRSVERLIRMLKETRHQLSLEHDVPYVAASASPSLLEQSF